MLKFPSYLHSLDFESFLYSFFQKLTKFVQVRMLELGSGLVLVKELLLDSVLVKELLLDSVLVKELDSE